MCRIRQPAVTILPPATPGCRATAIAAGRMVFSATGTANTLRKSAGSKRPTARDAVGTTITSHIAKLGKSAACRLVTPTSGGRGGLLQLVAAINRPVQGLAALGHQPPDLDDRRNFRLILKGREAVCLTMEH